PGQDLGPDLAVGHAGGAQRGGGSIGVLRPVEDGGDRGLHGFSSSTSMATSASPGAVGKNRAPGAGGIAAGIIGWRPGAGREVNEMDRTVAPDETDARAAPKPAPALSVRNLHTYFSTTEGVVKAVNGINLDLYPDRTLGLVGESGSGKSVAALSILKLIQS